MPTGAITEYIDVAQVVLYAFWIFFAFLILYLRREDKREGYPLESDRSDRLRVVGFPQMPPPKTYALTHGGTVTVPSKEPAGPPLRAEPTAPWPGAPPEPTGNPMLDGIGPGAWANRPDEPERALGGEPRIVPMRVAAGFSIEERDPDPRGMDVLGADGARGGRVKDVWVDRAEPQIRYLEVEASGGAGAETAGADGSGPPGGGARSVLLPIGLARIDGRRRLVRVESILGGQFAQVPATRQPDQVTQLEEDRISAYYGAGTLYAEPSRQESLV